MEEGLVVLQCGWEVGGCEGEKRWLCKGICRDDPACT
jgi:hypothetical protein